MASKVRVEIYVFLSAYGISISLNKNNEVIHNKDTFEKETFCRYKNLTMNFVFVYTIAVLTSFLREQNILDIYNQKGSEKGIVYIFLDMLGLVSYFKIPSINETWWNMSLEIALFL